ncbi:6-carboxytetrahydropterin synthase QueD [Alkaliphilus peptidifermentans]|uniref:6-carboxy-5,6,7,8-tetrahydropterin synthase n=1 Tax=Alkaliphilus peptidifermentans DSM 18978 TaxID=1120976 RepID=A0A1G5KLH0_9FIRM|nr:6-carboxytetrahydropterin synthase QueD [Alkaliphilus peptidifermentans]SCZ01214.1 6-pyruvoyltetrahydropterin/6-carboxytetrahydropterin synthase [Alkaliphilus peptidifermentans DSM 18978]
MNNKLIDVTKIFTFDSAHKLDDYDGDCKYLHGHTYRMEITIRGRIDYRGMVMDFNDLKELVKKEILLKLDHRYLNDVFDFNPTCENMLVWIFERLDESLKGEDYFIQKIVLWETPTSYGTLEREQYYAEN